MFWITCSAEPHRPHRWSEAMKFAGWQRLHAEYAKQFRGDENMKKSGPSQGQSASQLISQRIAELGIGARNPQQHAQAHQASRTRTSSRSGRWSNPVWSHDGIICTGESYKSVREAYLRQGASLKDPARLFNSSLEGNVRRAIDPRRRRR